MLAYEQRYEFVFPRWENIRIMNSNPRVWKRLTRRTSVVCFRVAHVIVAGSTSEFPSRAYHFAPVVMSKIDLNPALKLRCSAAHESMKVSQPQLARYLGVSIESVLAQREQSISSSHRAYVCCPAAAPWKNYLVYHHSLHFLCSGCNLCFEITFSMVRMPFML